MHIFGVFRFVVPLIEPENAFGTERNAATFAAMRLVQLRQVELIVLANELEPEAARRGRRNERQFERVAVGRVVPNEVFERRPRRGAVRQQMRLVGGKRSIFGERVFLVQALVIRRRVIFRKLGISVRVDAPSSERAAVVVEPERMARNIFQRRRVIATGRNAAANPIVRLFEPCGGIADAESDAASPNVRTDFTVVAQAADEHPLLGVPPLTGRERLGIRNFGIFRLNIQGFIFRQFDPVVVVFEIIDGVSISDIVSVDKSPRVFGF